MAKNTSLLLIALAAVVGIALGYLLGATPNSAAGKTSESLNTELLRQMVREEISTALREHEVRLGAVASTPATSNQAGSGAANVGLRTPSWELLLGDLEQAIQRINSAVSALDKRSSSSVPDQLKLAQSGLYPQNSRRVRDFCKRWEEDPEDEEIKRKELMFLTPTDILQRFGEPNDITLEIGSLYWEYKREWDVADGDTYWWYMDLTFTGGAVMDVSCSWYEG
ncbi:MAG: hypothetical protein H8E15_03300 [Planctomycetes bacterium]|nr:hypothetical protein [Planctomycetota bacterium]